MFEKVRLLDENTIEDRQVSVRAGSKEGAIDLPFLFPIFVYKRKASE